LSNKVIWVIINKNTQDIQGRYPLKPLKDNTIQENAILLYQQDIQGRYPLKPLKDNTIQENAILFHKQDIQRESSSPLRSPEITSD